MQGFRSVRVGKSAYLSPHPPPITRTIAATGPPTTPSAPAPNAETRRPVSALPPAPGAGAQTAPRHPPLQRIKPPIAPAPTPAHRISTRRSGSVMLPSTSVTPGWCSMFTRRLRPVERGKLRIPPEDIAHLHGLPVGIIGGGNSCSCLFSPPWVAPG